MENIEKFIKNYNFKEYLSNIEKDLVGEKYKNFVDEFWKNPSNDIVELKAKHNITNNISLKNILMQNPTQNYYNLLDDIWKNNISIDELIENYLITNQRLEQIKFSLLYKEENSFCPVCLNNEFEIINDFKNKKIYIKCNQCLNRVDNFIDKVKKESIISDVVEKQKMFLKEINRMEEELSEIKCHKCQSSLVLDCYFDTLNYKISCSKCEYLYDSIDDAKEKYELWKRQAAIMANLKSKEQELLMKTLAKKSEDEIKYKSEAIINNDEGIIAIENLIDIKNSDADIFSTLFKRYLKLNRMDRKILIYICKDLKVNSSKTFWRKGKISVLDMVLKKYDEPIVYVLMEETKLIPIRSILRRLIKQGLVYCNEEENELQVHPLLIENLDKLESTNKTQNINNQIAYMIFNKQNYICYHCGESGSPLKIAYITTDKNINDISSLVGICDFCYDDITEDEIIIDNIISLADEKKKELGEAWRFLIKHDKNFINDEFSEIEHENLYCYNDSNNLIRAYAISLYKKEKDGFSNNKLFFSYAKAILENSNGDVNVSKIVEEKYRLDSWLR